MKLYFKQRLFSWFDSYDIYDYDTGDVVYTVEGQLAWGHCLHILDADGRHIATVKQRVLTFLPKFDLYLGDACIGTICKEFTIVRPLFTLDFNGWQVQGTSWAGSTRSQTGSGRWPPSPRSCSTGRIPMSSTWPTGGMGCAP